MVSHNELQTDTTMDDLIPRDFADNDLYKFTMGQVVFRWFDRAIAKYRYTNRSLNKVYPKGFADRVMDQVRGMSALAFSESMYQFFKTKCPWMRETYLQWLRGFRFNPRQVKAWQDENGELHIEIVGLWFETIYWEVPLLYIVSQLAHTKADGTMDAFVENWREMISTKAKRLAEAGVNWIDFGTRRRAAFEVQDAVVDIMKEYPANPLAPNLGGFRGTSNPYLAMKYGLTAHGTNAHELAMAMQAKYGMVMCNKATMDHWIAEFEGSLGIALTDTVTTPVFLRDFNAFYARLYDGVRQDSGDPKTIGEMYVGHYKKLNIDPLSKMVVFSDSLNVDKAIGLHQHFLNRIRTTMGIGTHFTNDVGWPPSNHVIKLVEIDFGHGFIPLLKMSDDFGKLLGGNVLYEDAKRVLRI
jgi:nicotinate phosphoribosyltransferase